MRSNVPSGPHQATDPEAKTTGSVVSYARAFSLQPYVFYGSELSYFTRKLHAALHWSHLPYEWYPKHMKIQAEIEAKSGTGQMPVMVTPENWVIADTSPIMHLLDQRLPFPIFYPTYSPESGSSLALVGALVHVVEEYLDEWLPRAAVHFRWNYPESANFAKAIIGRDAASAEQKDMQVMAGDLVQRWGGKALRALGVADVPEQEQVEAEFLRVFHGLANHLEALYTKHGDEAAVFVLGQTPCAIDAVLVGALWAHFAADPSCSKLLEQECPVVIRWASKLRSLSSGDWTWENHHLIDPNELPHFLQVVLKEMSGPYMTFIRLNAAALREQRRSISADLYGDGRTVSYLSRPYPELSRQRASQWIHSHLSTSELQALDEILFNFGLADFLTPSKMPTSSL